MTPNQIQFTSDEAERIETNNKNYAEMCKVDKNLVDLLISKIDPASSEYKRVYELIVKYRESINQLSEVRNNILKETYKKWKPSDSL